MDKYGRYVNGREKADIKVGYEYKVTYPLRGSGSGSGGKSFGEIRRRNVVTLGEGRINAIVWRDIPSVNFYNYHNPDKWNISINHSYNPANGTILTGAGDIVDNDTLYRFKIVADVPNIQKFDKNGRGYYYKNKSLYRYNTKTKEEELVIENMGGEYKFKLDNKDMKIHTENDFKCYNKLDNNKIKKYSVYEKLKYINNNDFYLSYFEYATNKTHYYYEVFIGLDYKVILYSILEKYNHKIGNNYIKFLYPTMKFLNQFKVIPIIKENYKKYIKNFIYFPLDSFDINKKYYKISFSFINYDKIWKIKNNVSLFISIDSKKSFILTHKTFIKR